MAVRRPMRDDSRHGVTATVVFAEDLTQKAPNSSDRAKHSVPKLHAMLVEHILNAGLGQNVGERESLIVRKASAHCIQARHGTAFKLTTIPTA
jgi:hypothetical protein